MALRTRRPGRNGTIAGAGALAALVAVVVLVVAVGPCTDDDDPATPPPPTDPTTTTLSPEQQVQEAYEAFARMGARLLQAPDPNDHEIAQRATGKAREDLISGLTALRESNQRYELGPQYAHEVLSVRLNGDTAVLEVCLVDDVRLLDVATGSTVGAGVTTSWSTVALTQVDQAWLVSSVTEDRVEEGETECI